MSDAVDDAVAVFRSLGLDRLSPQQVATAPVGDDRDRARARPGFADAPDWFNWQGAPEEGWGHRTPVEADAMAGFGVFAIRIGVPARRVVTIVDELAMIDRPIPDDALVSAVAERGGTFATEFVRRAAAPGTFRTNHIPQTFAAVVVRLVVELDLPVPDDLNYLSLWAECVATSLADLLPLQPGEWRQPHGPTVEEPVALARVAEHVRAAVGSKVRSSGPLSAVLQEVARRGVMARDELIDLCAVGLDLADRPSDRSSWLRFLEEELALTDAEILQRAQQFTTALRSGAPDVVDRIGTVLLAGVPERDLADVVTTALLAVGSKRLRSTILTTLARRPRPGQPVAEEISATVAGLGVGDVDPRAVRTWSEAWATTGVRLRDREAAPLVDRRPPPEVQPAVRFDVADPSPAALTAAIRELLALPSFQRVTPLETERVLALLVACADDDVAAIRPAVRGVRENWRPGLRSLSQWLIDPTGLSPQFEWDLADAREACVVSLLGEIPCLLSQPTWEDLRIDAADLRNRLDHHQDAGAAAGEADLLLALARTDPATLTPELSAAIGGSTVTVRTSIIGTGAPTAGEIAGLWFRTPVPEPRRPDTATARDPEGVGADLARLLRRYHDRSAFGFWEFPHWGDGAMRDVGINGDAVSQGVIALQLARRSSPLPPGAATNLLAALRSPHPDAADLQHRAVRMAFDRGVLRPGSADPALLDWQPTIRQVAALVGALLELAGDGLVSLVWPFLDELAAASARAPSQLLSGTDAVVDAVAVLLPSVERAVRSGAAGAGALDLPGLRALAERTGHGRTLVVARGIADRLPAPVARPTAATLKLFWGRTFEDLWPASRATVADLHDPASIGVDVEMSYPGTGGLLLTARFPDLPGQMYFLRTWSIGRLVDDGSVTAESIGGASLGGWVRLRWNSALGRHDELPDEPPQGVRETGALSTTAAVVLLAAMHDGSVDPAPALVEDDRVSAATIGRAADILLASDATNPGRLAQAVVSSPTVLPAFWPVLTAGVRRAGAETGGLPRWVGVVLGCAVEAAPLLQEAHRRGLVPASATTWQGAEAVAARAGKSVAVRKARELVELMRSAGVV